MTRFQEDNRKKAKFLAPEVATIDEAGLSSFLLDIVNNSSGLRDVEIIASVVGGEINQTIEGASTLEVTVRDPEGEILNSGMFARAIDVKVDRLVFRLVALQKNDDELTLVFEDRIVSRIKQGKKVKSMSRRSMTRAQFCIYLVKQLKTEIPYVVPQLNKRQSIKTQREPTEAQKDRVRASGIDRDAELKVAGAKATRAQISIMELVLDEAYAIPGMTDEAVRAMLCANIKESKFLKGIVNPNSGAKGVFQVMPFLWKYINWNDIVGGVHIFMKIGFTNIPARKQDWTQLAAQDTGALKFTKNHPEYTPGAIASFMEGSDVENKTSALVKDGRPLFDSNGNPRLKVTNPFYDAALPEAKEILKAYGGQGEEVAEKQYRKQYRFTSQDGGKAQNYWDAIGRLMEEVGWRRFVSNGVLYISSETDLFKSKSRITLSEKSEGVVRINFDYDTGKKLQQATITARAERWIAPAGSCITIEDAGPASGKWLVSNIKQNLFSRDCSIDVIKPTAALPEPVSDTLERDDEPTEGPRPVGKPVKGKAREIKGVTLDRRWAGTQAIFEQFITPFMRDKGLTGSFKRAANSPESRKNPDSDHNEANTNAYAGDYATFQGLNPARALANAIGFTDWQPDAYVPVYNIKIEGKMFRVQILWGSAIGHGDHIHVGVKRI